MSKQATIKQVQFLEKLEQKTGVPYTGRRWEMNDVSSYIEKNKPEQANKPTPQQNQRRGITDKQKQYIKVLENKTGIFFNGKTFEDAEKYIKANRSV